MKVRNVLMGATIVAGALLGGACTAIGGDVSVETGPGQSPSEVGGDQNSTDASGSSPGDGGAAPIPSVSDPSAEPYVEALAQLLREQSDSDEGADYTEQQITCFAPRVVALYGTDRLEEAGIKPEGMETNGFGVLDVVVTEEGADAFWNLYEACDIDVVGMAVGMWSDGGSPETVTCIEERVTERMLRRTLRIEMTMEYDEESGDDPSGIGRTLMVCGQLGHGS